MKTILRWLIASSLLALSQLVNASDVLPFTEAKFAALTQAGGPLLIDVHATWCSTCKKQQEVLKQLLETDKYKGYTMLVVDFDKQTDVLAQFKVSQRSTLIVLRGEDEWGRSTAITSQEAISGLLDQALK
jgi:thioredoxin-like negative regulator of GroEL